jgi:nucleoside-diphosphate-sugar epimerase
MEKTLRAAGDLGAIWTIVRPTSIWGPWFDEPYRDFFRIIRRGLYIQPKGIITRKQWGFVGNTVFQVQSLLQAPAESVHTRLFYLADYEPLVLSNFAVQVQAAFSAPHVRELPLSVLKVLARMGDTIRLLGWQNPPLSTFRLGNILAEELQDIAPLETIAGPLPFSVAAGIRQTVRWMEEADGKGKSS